MVDEMTLAPQRPQVRDGSERDRETRVVIGLGLVAGLGAVLASSCCVLPLAMVAAGLGTAWLGALGGLFAYGGAVLVAAAALVGLGWVLALRRGVGGCELPDNCAGRLPRTLSLGTLMLGTLLVCVAALISRFEPSLLSFLTPLLRTP